MGTLRRLLEKHRDKLKDDVIWNIEQGRRLTPDQVARASSLRTAPRLIWRSPTLLAGSLTAAYATPLRARNAAMVDMTSAYRIRRFWDMGAPPIRSAESGGSLRNPGYASTATRTPSGVANSRFSAPASSPHLTSPCAANCVVVNRLPSPCGGP